MVNKRIVILLCINRNKYKYQDCNLIMKTAMVNKRIVIHCCTQMQLGEKLNKKDGYRWICYNKACEFYKTKILLTLQIQLPECILKMLNLFGVSKNKKIKSMKGIKREHLPGLLNEMVWRSNFDEKLHSMLVDLLSVKYILLLCFSGQKEDRSLNCYLTFI